MPVVRIRILIGTTVVWIRILIGTTVVRIRILIGTTVLRIASVNSSQPTIKTLRFPQSITKFTAFMALSKSFRALFRSLKVSGSFSVPADILDLSFAFYRINVVFRDVVSFGTRSFRSCVIVSAVGRFGLNRFVLDLLFSILEIPKLYT